MRKLTAGMLVLLGLLLIRPTADLMAWAQGSAEEASNEKSDRRGPLPYYFGKLGLSDRQRDSLYGVQEEYEKKFEPLREQLKKLVRERDEKMESLLTAGQKLRLQELREEALKRGEKPAADPAAEIPQ